MLVREEGVVALLLFNGHLKANSMLEPVLRCEPSTIKASYWHTGISILHIDYRVQYRMLCCFCKESYQPLVLYTFLY